MSIDFHKISIDEAKVIAQEVLDEENKKYDLDLYVASLKFHEYYSSDIFKNKLRLADGGNKIWNVLLPFKHRGLYSEQYHEDIDEHILVFPTRCLFQRNMKREYAVVELLKTCYHEVTHALQFENRVNHYNIFQDIGIFNMEEAISFFDYKFYKKYHDKFMKEIDADYNGMIKASKYLKERNFDYYSDVKNYIDDKNVLFEARYKNYDMDFFINKIYDLYKNDSMNFFSNNNSPFYPYPSLFCKYRSCEFKSVSDIMDSLDIFLNKEKYLTMLTEQKVDENAVYELFYSFVTSELFLNKLDFDSLSDNEINFMKNACSYMLKKEKDKEKYNNDLNSFNIIDDKLFVVFAKRNIKRISLLDSALKKINSSNINKFNSYLDVEALESKKRH